MSDDAARRAPPPVRACVACGSGDLFRSPERLTRKMIVDVGHVGGLVKQKPPDTVICAQCGFIHAFLPREMLGRLRESWERVV